MKNIFIILLIVLFTNGYVFAQTANKFGSFFLSKKNDKIEHNDSLSVKSINSSILWTGTVNSDWNNTSNTSITKVFNLDK